MLLVKLHDFLTAEFILPLRADVIIISHPKAGRTWIRVMLNEIFNLKCGLQGRSFKNVRTTSYEFLEKSRMNKQVPKVIFTHLGSDRLSWLNSRKAMRFLKNTRLVILVRDPRDIMISYYFQLTKRTTNHKVSRMSLSEFIRSTYLQNLLNFMNTIEKDRKFFKNALLLRYEDLHKNTKGELDRLLKFLDVHVQDEVLEKALAVGKFENMLAMEQKHFLNEKTVRGSAEVLQTWNIHDRDAYKVRRGKVGGYIDYLDKEDIEYLNAEIQNNLSPSLGY
jgi:hypothetical protein